MDLYATFTRNVHGTGGNENAWRLKVFEAGAEVADDVVYDHILTAKLSLVDQIVGLLGNLGFRASATDVARVGDGYRIDNVRRIE